MLCNLLANLVIILRDIQQLIFTTHMHLEMKPNPVKLKDGVCMEYINSAQQQILLIND